MCFWIAAPLPAAAGQIIAFRHRVVTPNTLEVQSPYIAERVFILIARKTPSFRAGMQSADSEAVLKGAAVVARYNGE